MTTRSHLQTMPDKANMCAVVVPVLYQKEIGGLNACDYKQVQSQMVGENKFIVQRATFRKSKRAQSATDDESWVEDGQTNTINPFDVGDVRATTISVDVYNQAVTGDITGTVTSATGICNASGPKIQSRLGVRRLTPVECERLQGFPDGWTDGQADCHRYKQLGNAVTVNVAEWLARRAMTALGGARA